MRNSFNYLKYIPRIFFKKHAFPLYVLFFVTTRCNASCKHCLLTEKYPGSSELSINEIEKISRSMEGFLFLLLTGGEPFLRDDLNKIVEIFYKNNAIQNVIIPTNGFFTEKIVRFVRNVLESCPDLDLGVDVSIDGIGKDHDRIRGVDGLFDAATKTFKELKELAKQYSRFHVSVETTVSYYNQDKLLELHRYLRENLGAVNIFPLLTRGHARDPISKNVDISKYEEFVFILEAEIRNGTLRGYHSFPFSDFINAKRIIRHKMISDIARRRRVRLPCFAGDLFATIFSRGEVLACELLEDKSFGSLRNENYDFKKIWFGKKAEEVRKYIKKTSSNPFCTFECPLSVNILFNYKMWPAVLKEWLSLKASRRKRKGMHGGPEQ